MNFIPGRVFSRSARIADVHHVETTTSTQDVLRTLADARHLTTVVAEEQTRGRGRLGRTWESTPGTSLLASTLITLPDTAAMRADLGFLTLLGALSLRSAVSDYTGGSFLVKFPNDVVNPAGQKLAGILGEFFTDLTAKWGGICVALGIGLNIHQRGEALFPGACSLASEGLLARSDVQAAGVADEILARYLQGIRDRLAVFAAGPAPASALVAEANTHLAYRNAQATVAGVTGVVRRITDRAELVIATADGERTIAPSAVAMLIEREEIPCVSLSKKGTP
ncbi:biotin--[acetyl-CoA-carboxylase] ligase [Trueperella pyogenes]|uniref:biotin--[acetyl-CoA-carboxylase] ligase n=1 Tax=Trueperella pyogenes TaxID=1661 RepID=UPI001013CBFF|nr:biotin--[acetyl-CoA-carboxylase] ligase [Trueperella pyogenes]